MSPHRILAGRHPDLADDVLLAVEEISKKPPNPPPNPPRWMAKFLPGAEWSAAAMRDDGIDDEEEEEEEMDDEPDMASRLSAIRQISFELRSGSALGLVGPDPGARRALLWMIAGFVPPATGRILIRGHVGPLFNVSELNITRQMGERAVKLTSSFFHWPWDVIKSRWDEITEFARIHEITDWPEDSIEYEAHRTKRLLLSTALHMDASVYLVAGNFYAIEPEFVSRCHRLLEQRLREGCAVVHSIGDPENLARFCHEAIYIDTGKALFRGRIGEVARFAHQRPAVVDPGAARLPLRVTFREQGPIRIGPDGGSIEIELDIVKRVELEFGIVLVDEAGRRVRIEAPDRVHERPGIYELNVRIPGDLLHPATYQGTLFGTESEDPLDEAEEAETLGSFELEVLEGPPPSGEVERIVNQVDWDIREITD